MSSIVDKKDTVEYITSLQNILYSKTNFNQLLAKGNIEKKNSDRTNDQDRHLLRK